MVRDSGETEREVEGGRRERGEIHCVLRDGRETEVRQGTHNPKTWPSGPLRPFCSFFGVP